MPDTPPPVTTTTRSPKRSLLVVVVVVGDVAVGVVVAVGSGLAVVEVGRWDPFGGAVAAFAGYRDGGLRSRGEAGVKG